MLKFLIFLLVAALVGLFFVKGPDGSPVLSLDDFAPDMSEVSAPDAVQAPTEVYRWQDENGVWQFSNQPQDAELGETIELDGDINLMPAVDTATLSRGDQSEVRAAPKINIPDGLTSVSGDQAEDMMDTVNNLQKTVDSRKADLDKAGN